jgi:hypothetical protein
MTDPCQVGGSTGPWHQRGGIHNAVLHSYRSYFSAACAAQTASEPHGRLSLCTKQSGVRDTQNPFGCQGPALTLAHTTTTFDAVHARDKHMARTVPRCKNAILSRHANKVTAATTACLNLPLPLSQTLTCSRSASLVTARSAYFSLKKPFTQLTGSKRAPDSSPLASKATMTPFSNLAACAKARCCTKSHPHSPVYTARPASCCKVNPCRHFRWLVKHPSTHAEYMCSQRRNAYTIFTAINNCHIGQPWVRSSNTERSSKPHDCSTSTTARNH